MCRGLKLEIINSSHGGLRNWKWIKWWVCNWNAIKMQYFLQWHLLNAFHGKLDVVVD